jgi:integrase
LNSYPQNISQNSHSVVTPGPAPAYAYFSYDDALSLRAMALQAGLDVPSYLLAPEIATLLRYLPDLHQQLLIDTLWNTGCRINEALALTPASFMLDGARPFVVLKTLKQRQRGKGRPGKDEAVKRAVPLTDPQYVRKLREYLATFRVARQQLIWPLKSDTTPRNWINAAVARAERDMVTFSISPITPHTFRHSFCMHLIQCAVPLKVVQAYAGHSRLESTERYTRVFALDVGRQFGVRFSVPEIGHSE